MLDIIKDFIRLNQEVALFPLQAAKKLLDDRNSGTKQFLDTAEDFVSAPFAAAEKAVDGSCKTCSRQDGSKTGIHGKSGPSLRNIWVDPRVEVFSDVEVKPGERRTELIVTGLLCGG